MRRYGLYDASRGLTLALAAALAGLGLWGATQVGMQTTGRFWLSMAIVAGAGLLIALAGHVGTWTKGLRLRVSPGTFVLAFLPVLVVRRLDPDRDPAGQRLAGGETRLVEQLDRDPRRRALDRPLARRAGVRARSDARPLARRRPRAGDRGSAGVCRPRRRHSRAPGGRARRSRAPLQRQACAGDSARDSHRGDDADADPDTVSLTARIDPRPPRTSEAAADPCREGSR